MVPGSADRWSCVELRDRLQPAAYRVLPVQWFLALLPARLVEPQPARMQQAVQRHSAAVVMWSWAPSAADSEKPRLRLPTPWTWMVCRRLAPPASVFAPR